MDCRKALKSGIIVAILLVTVSLATQQLAQAQQSQDRGLLGNFADGNRDGLAAGAADYREGYDKYAYCPGGTADYCAGFTVGYNDGYDSARKVG
ncbi:MAG: hypothetical protein WA941_06860 [Nitrososphaeraceae archaeon]